MSIFLFLLFLHPPAPLCLTPIRHLLHRCPSAAYAPHPHPIQPPTTLPHELESDQVRVGRVTAARLTALGTSRGRTSTQLTERLGTLYKVSTPTPPDAQDAGSAAPRPSVPPSIAHVAARLIPPIKRLNGVASGSNLRIF